MDIAGTDNQKQPISDDQELAKALAGVTQETENMSYEETNTPSGLPPVVPPVPSNDLLTPSPVVDEPITPASVVGGASSDLEGVKQAALSELRPLISKLDVSPEEKFDTYLLLIRSTDDQSLIAPAHEAAQGITDEAKKAQALLDIIKEIDFLSNPKN